ncbi:V-type ATP synthase subunit B [Treponema succinifaciens]|uniref:V-type ATPase, D subunit n=2 Tax=Treponema TaxID=157 RepID=F2NSV0_TRES6|nr:V-type ATP synthase subunit B [Treponema succinifaciens]AEB14338.1 V-type ATPase, D subunit [Treponema succinifaciens DSM 2489]
MNKVYSKIESINGSVITVKAKGVKLNELAEINTRFGKSLAEVNKIDGDTVSLQVFAGGRGVATNDQIRFLGHEMRVSFSENLLGRIFNGSAEPRDHGPALTENLVAIGGPSVNPAKRINPNRMMRTNIPMIDVFNTLVVSQKIPIFSISGEPYNQLLARIAMQAQADVIVLGGMGLKYDDYLYFKKTLEEGGALSKTVMFVHTAADPTVECIKIPDLSLAVAEQFALQGKDVLVLLTDMTNFADSMKEIAITQEQVPSNRGYPGDLYSQLASRYEKAVDFADSGSITVYEGADFGRGDYNLYSTPLWIDMAADRMEKALELDLEAEVLDEQVRLLAKELRTTTQRVNLFEKVKIPETKANIKRIGIFLGDEQVNAVVRSKISKKKLQADAKEAE